MKFFLELPCHFWAYAYDISGHFYFSDQHFHDPSVKLWEWPPRVVHLCEPGQLRSELDQPEIANSASSATSAQVLWALPWAKRSSLAGNTEHSLLGWKRKTSNLWALNWCWKLCWKYYSWHLTQTSFLSTSCILFNNALYLFCGLFAFGVCFSGVLFVSQLVWKFCLEDIVSLLVFSQS